MPVPSKFSELTQETKKKIAERSISKWENILDKTYVSTEPSIADVSVTKFALPGPDNILLNLTFTIDWSTVTGNVTIGLPKFYAYLSGDYQESSNIQVKWNGPSDTKVSSLTYTYNRPSNPVYQVSTEYNVIVYDPDAYINYVGPKHTEPLSVKKASWTGKTILTSVNVWSNDITYFHWTFNSCINLVSVPSSLPTSAIDLTALFNGCANLSDDNIGSWDLTNVKSVNRLFTGCLNFNVDLSGWGETTSGITDFQSMFTLTGLFVYGYTYDLSSWAINTTQDVNMKYMFGAFNWYYGSVAGWERGIEGQPGYSSMKRVTNLKGMFSDVFYLSENLDWDTSSCTDMAGMFSGDFAFDNNYIDYGFTPNIVHFNGSFGPKWDTSNVTDMQFMFCMATSFDQDISNWNVKNVTDMSFMFAGCRDDEYYYDDGNQTSGVYGSPNGVWTPYYESYYGPGPGTSKMIFNHDLSNWERGVEGESGYSTLKNVKKFEKMFYYSDFNQDISNWNVSGVLVGSYVPALFGYDAAYLSNDPDVNLAEHGDVHLDYYDPTHVYSDSELRFASAGKMFSYSAMSVSNVDAILENWTNGVPNELNITLGMDGLEYSNPSALNNFKWTPTGLTQFVAPCFNKGTKVLTDIGNVAVEHLKPGMLVETYIHGLVPVKYVASGKLVNNPEVPEECMYRSGDLVLTGGHSVLVDTIPEELVGKVLDGKHLLLACLSDSFEQLTDTGVYEYFHIVLEHSGEPDRQYGIWAESVLTETLSESYFLAKKYL
uniref:Hedgehog/Intein (Hint) domain-containing protein n=1 Tax=viral metagenome TaxID=1070528 RepID=A0A6C0I924_9ZZZZ